ncbi:MAG: PDZ domain-containing protein, partial [Gemmatimonadaceae bacterium]|nr:PDZ domain-containing protein [Gemmatimonadaceae bacterium]
AKVAGVKVGGFTPEDAGPSKAAGIEVGDVIVAIDGKPVERVSSLQRIVRSRQVGQTVSVDVLRYGSKKSFKVRLAEASAVAAVATAPTTAPSAAPVAGKLGISVEALAPEMAKQMGIPADKGVRVGEVSQDGPARDKLVAGTDVILEVLYPTPRRSIKSVNDLQSIIGGLKSGDYVSLLVLNVVQGGGTRVVNLRVGE